VVVSRVVVVAGRVVAVGPAVVAVAGLVVVVVPVPPVSAIVNVRSGVSPSVWNG